MNLVELHTKFDPSWPRSSDQKPSRSSSSWKQFQSVTPWQTSHCHCQGGGWGQDWNTILVNGETAEVCFCNGWARPTRLTLKARSFSLRGGPTGLNTGKDDISQRLPFQYGPRCHSCRCWTLSRFDRLTDYALRKKSSRQHSTIPGITRTTKKAKNDINPLDLSQKRNYFTNTTGLRIFRGNVSSAMMKLLLSIIISAYRIKFKTIVLLRLDLVALVRFWRSEIEMLFQFTRDLSVFIHSAALPALKQHDTD